MESENQTTVSQAEIEERAAQDRNRRNADRSVNFDPAALVLKCEELERRLVALERFAPAIEKAFAGEIGPASDVAAINAAKEKMKERVSKSVERRKKIQTNKFKGTKGKNK